MPDKMCQMYYKLIAVVSIDKYSVKFDSIIWAVTFAFVTIDFSYITVNVCIIFTEFDI
jgi:hypothetical protein